MHFANQDKSPGIKRGGVLNVVAHELEVIAPANAIPSELVVDLTGLDIGSPVHLSALKLPEGVTVVTHEKNQTVATIAAPTVATAGDEEATAARPKAVSRRARRLIPCVCWWGWATLAVPTPATATISAIWRRTKSSAAIAFPAGDRDSTAGSPKERWLAKRCWSEAGHLYEPVGPGGGGGGTFQQDRSRRHVSSSTTIWICFPARSA